MGKASRKTDWLMQFSGSKNWFVRLRNEKGKRYVKSLGTSDREQAVILALPEIAEHKKRLLAARPKIETAWQSAMEPGLHTDPDGGHIAATERELTYYNHNGALLRTEPNGGPAFGIVGAPLSVETLATAYIEADIGEGRGARRTVAGKNDDDQVIETYITHKKLNPRIERDTRKVWALFKKLTNNKRLKDCTRADGRALVAYYESEEGGALKRATIQKNIGWLTSAVNLAISEGREGDPNRLIFNPFSAVVSKEDDDNSIDRLPLSNDDIAATKAKLGTLSANDQLLFKMLAATGMRLSEAFEIGRVVKIKVVTRVNGKTKVEWKEQVNRDQVEGGCRFVIVGHKTEQSKRRVPFPAVVLDDLPGAITAPLFAGTSAAASKRLNRFLRKKCDIDDPAKVVHSLRHRAKDRLRAAGCRKELQEEIFGRDEKTVGDGYGEGSPVPQLKRWIDKIGY